MSRKKRAETVDYHFYTENDKDRLNESLTIDQFVINYGEKMAKEAEKLKTLNERLSEIQKKLKANKGQFNKFGNYSYRSCEDILESVKPLLGECALILNDEMILIGDRYYVKATAFLLLGDQEVKSTAFAREPLNRKGMDEAQVTGATSSYARKYALNGLFCIDDGKDPDSQDNSHNGKQVEKPKPVQSNFENYVIPFGKFKGILMQNVKSIELEGYVDFIKTEAGNKPLSGPVLEFLNMFDKMKKAD